MRRASREAAGRWLTQLDRLEAHATRALVALWDTAEPTRAHWALVIGQIDDVRIARGFHGYDADEQPLAGAAR